MAGFANPQNLNRFSYVLNNPLRYIDPTGHRVACEDGDVCWSPNTTSNSTSGNGRHRRHRQDDDLDPYPNKVQGDGTSISSSTAAEIGVPQHLGSYQSGIWMGGGQPNDYYVGGVYFEQVGDRIYVTTTGSGLHYGATYGVEFYEHGSILYIDERYSLSENTFYTEIDAAGSVLNIRTSDGVAHQVVLGELEIGDDKRRTTTINIYGSYPADMNITLFINLSETKVLTAPLPSFEFFNQPSSVYP